MASRAAETLIGALVLVAAGGFFVYGARRAELGTGLGAYEVVARFARAEGIGIGSDVRIAGVKVGSVTGLSLDPVTFEAVARLSIAGDLRLPEDSDARIATEGLLGGAFVAIGPGGAEEVLKPGGEIALTQGSVSLVELFMTFGGGSTEKPSE